MMTTAGNGPSPSGFISVAGICSDEPAGVTVRDDCSVLLACKLNSAKPSARIAHAWEADMASRLKQRTVSKVYPHARKIRNFTKRLICLAALPEKDHFPLPPSRSSALTALFNQPP